MTCALLCAAGFAASAATILQQPGETFIAFEAELNGDVLNGPVQSFGAIGDGTASGGSALKVTHPTNPPLTRAEPTAIPPRPASCRGR
jgi:hypothetical protein